MKRVTTTCPEHENCSLRVTTGTADGKDIVEHSSVTQAQASDRTLADIYKRLDEMWASLEDLGEAVKETQRAINVIVNDAKALEARVTEQGHIVKGDWEKEVGRLLDTQAAMTRTMTAQHEQAKNIDANVSNFKQEILNRVNEVVDTLAKREAIAEKSEGQVAQVINGFADLKRYVEERLAALQHDVENRDAASAEVLVDEIAEEVWKRMKP